MKLVLLGGMSPHNKPWIYQVRDALAPLFDECLVHEYAHWNDAEKTPDLEFELAAVADKVKSLSEYVVFAKSFGTALTLKGINGGLLSPVACLFAGLPLALIKEKGLVAADWLAASQVPTIIVQNTDDPVGGFAELKAYTAGASSTCQLVELPGNTHEYSDLQRLGELASSLLDR